MTWAPGAAALLHDVLSNTLLLSSNVLQLHHCTIATLYHLLARIQARGIPSFHE